MIRRVGILALTCAFAAGAGQIGLRSGTWVLCVGSEGHLAIEAVDICCVPESTVDQAPAQQSWVSEDCGPCTDYPLALAARSAQTRGEDPGNVAPASISERLTDFQSPPSYGSAILETAYLRTSPRLASPAPLRC